MDSHTPPGSPLLRDRLARVPAALIDLVFPAACGACGRRLLEDEYGVCADCYATFSRPPAPLCSRCGIHLSSALAAKPLPKGAPEGACADCAHLDDSGFEAARGAFRYNGAIVAVLHDLKYRGNTPQAEALARWAFIEWRERWPAAWPVDLILPVPLYWWRRIRRGFNQAELLCQSLARLSGVPTAPDILTRTRQTRTQTRLTPEQRLRNVNDAFRVDRPELVAGKTILLLDDVMTTGATLHAAARALRIAGAARIFAFAVARAG